jgi:Asp-tRNA(Asn)/Glu-tRNA(Gln) amidotransferase A subunit family amidase
MKYLTVTAALARIRGGHLTSSDLLEACLHRLDERESQLQAWTFLATDMARTQAALYDRQRCDRSPHNVLVDYPLWGIPVGIKDIFATLDMPTAWGISLYQERYLSEEAAVVTRLKAAGAIILGKTVTTELATAAAGPTRNPHHLDHTPGGSSSGSAAAVADGMVPIALGSQTMGSILRPAAYCGIFGFKPSFGAISRQGVMPVSPDLDHVGWFARSLDDIARVFAVLADPYESSMGGQPVQSRQSPSYPHLAWMPTPDWPALDPVAQTRLTEAIAVLSQANIVIVPVDLPAPCDDYWETVQTLCAYGLHQNHGGLINNHAAHCSPQLQDWIRRGRRISQATYESARMKQQAYRTSMATLFDRYDAILSPVTTGPAPIGLENTGSPRFCALWTVCGLPAINLPLGKTPDGLPLGCQLIGQPQGDRALLRIAQRCWPVLEAAFGAIAIPEG